MLRTNLLCSGCLRTNLLCSNLCCSMRWLQLRSGWRKVKVISQRDLQSLTDRRANVVIRSLPSLKISIVRIEEFKWTPAD